MTIVARCSQFGCTSRNCIPDIASTQVVDRHTADSDEAAPLFRDDCAPGFRDDLAPCLVGSAGD
ncbi:hypothetical protein CN221_32440, partial [Sinorhizobium meliloti]